jgi:hypothetical protein
MTTNEEAVRIEVVVLIVVLIEVVVVVVVDVVVVNVCVVVNGNVTLYLLKHKSIKSHSELVLKN